MKQQYDSVREQVAQASKLFALRHGDALKPGEAIFCELSEYDALHRLTLHIADESRDRDLEFHVDFAGELEANTEAEALMDALDFLDGVLAEFLAGDGESWPPLDPSPYTFEGRQLWLCGALRRPKAEAMAEKLLADDESGQEAH